MRTGDEDESLGDDGDLEVGDHVELRIIRLDGAGLEADAELVLEERGLLDDDDKSDTGGKVRMRTVTRRETTYVEAVR